MQPNQIEMPNAVAPARGARVSPDITDLRGQLAAECEVMLRHAMGCGIEVPNDVIGMAAQFTQWDSAKSSTTSSALPELANLTALHSRLAKIVAPSSPYTLYLLATDPMRGSTYSMLGPLPNIRRLTVGSIICTAAFMALSLSPIVNPENIAKDIYTMHGYHLLMILSFLLAAAGMGGTFHALFTAQTYIANGTYHPRFDASYWIRISLGVVAGLMLSVMVPLGTPPVPGAPVAAGTTAAEARLAAVPVGEPSGAAAEAAPAPVAKPADDSTPAIPGMPTMGKPLLALLGGFSAGLVHRLLQRLIETLESMFKGSERDNAQTREAQHKTATRQALTEVRTDVAERLIGLRDQIARGTAVAELQGSVSALVDDLLARQPASRPTPLLPAPATTEDDPLAASAGNPG